MGDNWPELGHAAKVPEHNDPNLRPEKLPTAEDSKFSHEKISDVAKALESDQKTLAGTGSGTYDNFISENGPGNLTYLQLGNYPAVTNGLEMTVRNAYNHVSNTYKAFNQSYEQLVKSLGRGGSNYKETEDANEKNARNAHPNTGNSRKYT